MILKLAGNTSLLIIYFELFKSPDLDYSILQKCDSCSLMGADHDLRLNVISWLFSLLNNEQLI